MINNKSLYFKKAIFPLIITVISFILFIIFYLLLTVYNIKPMYFKALVFAIPFVIFGIIMIFTANGKIEPLISNIVTGVLLPYITYGFIYVFIFIIFTSSIYSVDDINLYERTIDLNGYPENTLIEFFPEKIPANATEVKFHYNPAFLQGGETIALKFKTDPDSIESYKKQFSSTAKWIGTKQTAQAVNNEIGFHNFYFYNYGLPDDFTIYLLYSRSYQPNDWNHGEISTVAINSRTNEIMFDVMDW